MRDFRDVFENVLLSQDALVEPIEPDCLEICAPANVREVLGIGEWCRVGFSSLAPDDVERVTLESGWTEKLEKLMKHNGRYVSLSLENQLEGVSRPSKVEKMLANHLVLPNATYRLRDHSEAFTRFLFLTFRCTASSDDKRDYVFHMAINEMNGALSETIIDSAMDSFSIMEDALSTNINDSRCPDLWTSKQVVTYVQRALPHIIEGRLVEFLAGMKRRMGRDQDRLYEYHLGLHKEAQAKLAEKKKRGLLDENMQKDRLQLVAIEQEYAGKISDLRRKYAVIIDVELIQAMRLIVPVYRFNISFHRKKGVRLFLLDWNPLSRKLDLLPCEGCLSSEGERILCDGKLHFLCSKCFSSCKTCSKVFCRACFKKHCPSCNNLG